MKETFDGKKSFHANGDAAQGEKRWLLLGGGGEGPPPVFNRANILRTWMRKGGRCYSIAGRGER